MERRCLLREAAGGEGDHEFGAAGDGGERLGSDGEGLQRRGERGRGDQVVFGDVGAHGQSEVLGSRFESVVLAACWTASKMRM